MIEKSEKSKSELKLPVIDSLICKNCKKCIEVCPNNAIKAVWKNSCAKCVKYCLTMRVPCNPEKIIFDYEHCDNCGICIETCTENAIYWYSLEQV
jgi:Pyruvate/2-oxoacid:ferredoxin oxidoreductase delta subunit